MTLPTWENFMIPVLQNSSEEIKVLDIAEICAKHFNLSAEEMNLGYEKITQHFFTIVINIVVIMLVLV